MTVSQWRKLGLDLVFLRKLRNQSLCCSRVPHVIRMLSHMVPTPPQNPFFLSFWQTDPSAPFLLIPDCNFLWKQQQLMRFPSCFCLLMFA